MIGRVSVWYDRVFWHSGWTLVARLGSVGGNNSVVECDLAKVEVAGSNPVSRSNPEIGGTSVFRLRSSVYGPSPPPVGRVCAQFPDQSLRDRLGRRRRLRV